MYMYVRTFSTEGLVRVRHCANYVLEATRVQDLSLNEANIIIASIQWLTGLVENIDA